MKEKGKKKHFEGKALVMLIGETGKKRKDENKEEKTWWNNHSSVPNM